MLRRTVTTLCASTLAMVAGLCATSAQAQPANDNCAAAIDIPQSSLPASISGTLVGATQDGDATCAADFTPDVYYKITPTLTGNFRFSLCNAGTSTTFDTILSINASCPAAFGANTLVCDDDGCGTVGGSSRINSTQLNAGTTYIIRIGTYDATIPLEAFQLDVSYLGGPAPAPVNDLCTGAIDLNSVGLPYTATPDNTNATNDLDVTCNSGTAANRGIWYRYQSNANGCTLNLVQNGTQDTVWAIFTSSDNTCAGTLTQVFCDDPETTTFTTSPNTTYFILLARWGTSAPGAFVLGVNIAEDCGPTGACCTTASGACTTTLQSACTAAGTVWTQGAACDANVCPVPPAPANDLCANAQALQLNVAFTGNTTTATGDATEGSVPTCQSSFWKSVWFSFTAPASDVYGFTACGSSFDTVLSVFDGNCNAFGTEVGCDDDTCDGVTPAGSGLASVIAPIALNGGQTYLVRLSGYSLNTAQGAYTLTVTGTAPPVGGVCCRGVTCTTGLTAGTCTSVSSNGVTIAASFVSASNACNGSGVLTQPCCYGNFDRSADGVQVADIFAFLSAFFANSPYAVQQSTSGGADPTGTPGVPDIFNFLSSWFGAGGCV